MAVPFVGNEFVAVTNPPVSVLVAGSVPGTPPDLRQLTARRNARYLCSISEDGVMCIQCNGEIIGAPVDASDMLFGLIFRAGSGGVALFLSFFGLGSD